MVTGMNNEFIGIDKAGRGRDIVCSVTYHDGHIIHFSKKDNPELFSEGGTISLTNKPIELPILKGSLIVNKKITLWNAIKFRLAGIIFKKPKITIDELIAKDKKILDNK